MDAQRSAQFTTQSQTARVTGELDLASAAELERFLTKLDAESARVDFSGVTFFDSSALRALLRCFKHNAALRIVNPSASVVRVLELTQTYELFCDTDLQLATD